MPNKQLLGKTFKKEAKVVQTALEALQVSTACHPACTHPLLPARSQAPCWPGMLHSLLGQPPQHSAPHWLQEEDVICMRDTLAEGKPAPLTLASGQQVEIPADMVSISMKEKTLTGRWALHSLTAPPGGCCLCRNILCRCLIQQSSLAQLAV